jgi:hypothetical protein
MSFDYDKGYRGAAREEDTSESEYQRGVQDRIAGQPYEPGRGAMDLSRLREASFGMGQAWAKNPDATLKAMLKVIFGITVIGGVVGALFSGGNIGQAITFAKVFFWLAAGAIYVPAIIGVTLAGRGTRRGWLTILFLGGLVVYMAWKDVLYPVIFIHIR